MFLPVGSEMAANAGVGAEPAWWHVCACICHRKEWSKASAHRSVTLYCLPFKHSS